MMNFTLKWYGVYAETVRLYKDACIYLYKKTCSYQPQVVDNYFLKNIFICLSLLSFSISLTACSKVNPYDNLQNSALHLAETPHKHFQQYPGDQLHPSAYFTCGKYQNRCHAYSRIDSKQMQSQKINSSKLSKENKQYD